VGNAGRRRAEWAIVSREDAKEKKGKLAQTVEPLSSRLRVFAPSRLRVKNLPGELGERIVQSAAGRSLGEKRGVRAEALRRGECPVGRTVIAKSRAL
jgi:hypothetical protein